MVFEFVAFSLRRAQRNAKAADVKWTDGKEYGFVWMDRKDIKDNMQEFGVSHELILGLEAYGVNCAKYKEQLMDNSAQEELELDRLSA